MKYQQLITFILQQIGGKENILTVTHCMTRLRFTLKNDELVKEEELLKSPDIMTAQFAGGRYQIVVGTHVAQVYQELQQTLGLADNAPEEQKGFLNSLIDTITKVITPVLGILTASGLLQGILALLVVLNVLNTDDGAYIILHAMGQTVFYFLPVALGYTSAKAFKLNPYVGMMLGASLVIPELMTNLTTNEALYTLFQGSFFETPVYKTFFGLPILFPANGYQYTVIPVIFMTFVGAKVERFLQRVIPAILAHNLNAFLTILITVPLSILFIGPVTNVLSQLISAGVSGLYTISPIVTSIVVALLYQPLVILGLHWPLSAIGINNLATLGSDYIFPMSFTANFAQTAVVLAVFLRTRSKETKTLAIPAIISGIFCIIEPAIYGFSLPVKKRFAFSMLGGAVGSVILALFSAKMYTFSFGALGFVAFINPETGSMTGLYLALLATVATMAVAFLLTYFTFSEQVAHEPKDSLIHSEEILAPFTGTVKPLAASQDATFAKGEIGKGIVITPTEGELRAPVSGTVTTVFPGGHAIGITSSSGIEVLIHVGIDTVELKGAGFAVEVVPGQKVQQGQLLGTVDLAAILTAGYDTETVILITNAQEYLDVMMTEQTKVKNTDLLLTVIPFAQNKEIAFAVEGN